MDLVDEADIARVTTVTGTAEILNVQAEQTLLLYWQCLKRVMSCPDDATNH